MKGELDWVLLKALDKDRTRRYQTANGFAADIQRYLANEAVVARPPSTAYRLLKAWQRNKFVFVAGTAIAASLIIGIAPSVWQAVRAEREARRVVAALDELRATAPAFVEQARGLAAREQFDEAIEKLDYAAKLRPDDPKYLVAKGDLLQCQLRLAEAAKAYRAALTLRPDDARAKVSALLCDELLAAPLGEDGRLSRESLSKLHLAMQHQQRPAAELMPVAKLLGDEKKLVVSYWLERLKDLPISADKPLARRLTVREDGLLALDLSGTKIANLSPLVGMNLGSLSLAGCDQIADLTPLREFRLLQSLALTGTRIGNLACLRGLPLADLDLNDTQIFDLADLRGMKLTKLQIRNTRVSDLSPLSGMPLRTFDATTIPATDYSPLAGRCWRSCTFRIPRFATSRFCAIPPSRNWCCSVATRLEGLPCSPGSSRSICWFCRRVTESCLTGTWRRLGGSAPIRLSRISKTRNGWVDGWFARPSPKPRSGKLGIASCPWSRPCAKRLQVFTIQVL